jgi:hypothetical protein
LEPGGAAETAGGSGRVGNATHPPNSAVSVARHVHLIIDCDAATARVTTLVAREMIAGFDISTNS